MRISILPPVLASPSINFEDTRISWTTLLKYSKERAAHNEKLFRSIYKDDQRYNILEMETYLFHLCDIRLKLEQFEKLGSDESFQAYKKLPELRKLAVKVNLSRWDYVKYLHTVPWESPHREVDEELCLDDYQALFDDLTVPSPDDPAVQDQWIEFSSHFYHFCFPFSSPFLHISFTFRWNFFHFFHLCFTCFSRLLHIAF